MVEALIVHQKNVFGEKFPDPSIKLNNKYTVRYIHAIDKGRQPRVNAFGNKRPGGDESIFFQPVGVVPIVISSSRKCFHPHIHCR